MNDRPRRRRPAEPQIEARRGTFPLFPLLIVVVLAGLGLGALLSRHFGSQQQTTTTTTSTTTVAAPTPTDIPTASPAPSAPPTQTASPIPSVSPAATHPPKATPGPRNTPHRVALSSAQPKPTIKPSPSAPPAPTAAPTLKPSPPPAVHTPKPPTPRPATPKPATPKPTVAPPATGSAAATSMVRTYLDALIAGDTSTANRLLNRAPDAAVFPEQPIVNKSSHVTSVRSTDNGDGTYKIEAEISGSNGNFYCTYQTAHGDAGVYLTDNFCIRTQ